MSIGTFAKIVTACGVAFFGSMSFFGWMADGTGLPSAVELPLFMLCAAAAIASVLVAVGVAGVFFESANRED